MTAWTETSVSAPTLVRVIPRVIPIFAITTITGLPATKNQNNSCNSSCNSRSAITGAIPTNPDSVFPALTAIPRSIAISARLCFRWWLRCRWRCTHGGLAFARRAAWRTPRRSFRCARPRKLPALAHLPPRAPVSASPTRASLCAPLVCRDGMRLLRRVQHPRRVLIFW